VSAAPAVPSVDWHDANQAHLGQALARVKARLERHVAEREAAGGGTPAAAAPAADDAHAGPPMALEQVCASFRLSPFERDVLLLCAGVELDSAFASLCARAQGDPLRSYATFSLALAALPSAHWSALTPGGPLRRWRLVELGPGHGITLAPLRIDERVLHFLTGLAVPDERLAGVLDPVAPAELVASQRAVADRLMAVWSGAARGAPRPGVQRCGEGISEKRAVAGAACRALGLRLSAIGADAVPVPPGEVQALARLCERDTALTRSALLIEWGDVDPADSARAGAVTRFIDQTHAPLIVATRERRRLGSRATVVLDVSRPTETEQRALWRTVLEREADGLDGRLDQLVGQFSMGTEAIRTAGLEALGCATEHDAADLGTRLWQACRMQARTRLDDLAQRIDSGATWDELILPEAQRQILREIGSQVRHRAVVYERWGFGRQGSRGLGISAVFAGTSGTGKTMAAEVLGTELRLDLYRIDLSSVVSKYIGETEKNLRRVFDAAEEGGAILLFDEADALFGKRSEVKDSHDRYANIEVSYLLQRMETYRGLAILTTNLKSALDNAFLRRIRFVVQFPFPDEEQRAEIWRRVFPRDTPTDGLMPERLAQLNVAGGNIRSIALHAAFLAAERGEPVEMRHVLRAARTEYAKMEKQLTEVETDGWITAQEREHSGAVG
jgi:hypothetical protein